MVIKAFDDVPEHFFLIHSVEEDCVTEVKALFLETNTPTQDVLRVCLLTGMRSGEAAGLLREDLLPTSFVGHQSARSEYQLTYSTYSAGWPAAGFVDTELRFHSSLLECHRA